MSESQANLPGGKKRIYLFDDFDKRNNEELVEALGDSWIPIMPHHKYKMCWDVLIFFLLLWILIRLPWRVAFDESNGVLPMDIVTDIIFAVDIILTFLTAYEDWRGSLVTDLDAIARNYVKGWFWLDLLATFPFYLILDSSTGQLSKFAKLPKLVRLIRLVRLLRLFRARRFAAYLVRLEHSPRMHPGILRIMRLFIVSMFFIHFAGCMWYFLGDYQFDDENSWIFRVWNVDEQVADDGRFERYFTCIYYVISTLATVGFGDIHPQTSAELMFTSSLMLIGTSMIAFVTAAAASILATFDQQNQFVREKMQHLRIFCNGFKLEKDLTRRLVDSMGTTWRRAVAMRTDWTELLAEMPKQIRGEVARHMYSDLLFHSLFFQVFDDAELFVADIVCHLVPLVVHYGEYISRKGEDVSDWYIIQEGEVSAVSSANHNMVYYSLGAGESFGEISLFLTQKWESSMRVSSEECLLLAIDAKRMARFLSTDLQVQEQKLVDMKTDMLAKHLSETEMQERQTRLREPYICKIVQIAQARFQKLKMAKLRYVRAGARRMSKTNLSDQLTMPSVATLNLVADSSSTETSRMILHQAAMIRNLTTALKNLSKLFQQHLGHGVDVGTDDEGNDDDSGKGKDQEAAGDSPKKALAPRADGSKAPTRGNLGRSRLARQGSYVNFDLRSITDSSNATVANTDPRHKENNLAAAQALAAARRVSDAFKTQDALSHISANGDAEEDPPLAPPVPPQHVAEGDGSGGGMFATLLSAFRPFHSAPDLVSLSVDDDDKSLSSSASASSSKSASTSRAQSVSSPKPVRWPVSRWTPTYIDDLVEQGYDSDDDAACADPMAHLKQLCSRRGLGLDCSSLYGADTDMPQPQQQQPQPQSQPQSQSQSQPQQQQPAPPSSSSSSSPNLASFTPVYSQNDGTAAADADADTGAAELSKRSKLDNIQRLLVSLSQRLDDRENTMAKLTKQSVTQAVTMAQKLSSTTTTTTSTLAIVSDAGAGIDAHAQRASWQAAADTTSGS
jgi:CRP-like cAMP-binding protein